MAKGNPPVKIDIHQATFCTHWIEVVAVIVIVLVVKDVGHALTQFPRVLLLEGPHSGGGGGGRDRGRRRAVDGPMGHLALVIPVEQPFQVWELGTHGHRRFVRQVLLGGVVVASVVRRLDAPAPQHRAQHQQHCSRRHERHRSCCT